MGSNGKSNGDLCDTCGQVIPEYEDVPAATLGDLKKLEHVSNFNRRKVPRIRWGAVFDSWSWKRKAEWAMKVAHAYNHATDLIQRERNELIKICQAFEVKLEQAVKLRERETLLFNEEIARANAETQEVLKDLLKNKDKWRDRAKRQADEILRLREKCGEPLRQPKGT